MEILLFRGGDVILLDQFIMFHIVGSAWAVSREPMEHVTEIVTRLMWY